MALAKDRFIEGARLVSPILIGVIPFGLIVGVTIAGTEINNWVGWSTSWLIFGGAAQIALIELINSGAIAAVAIATPLVINLRHVMYSAALASQFGKLTSLDRLWLPYVLTDQAFVITASRLRPDSDATTVKYYYLGAALTLWTIWQISTVAGIVVGAQVPKEWSLDFAIPLVFLGLLAPAVSTRPALLAATVGGIVAVMSLDLPNGVGIIVASIAGVTAGSIAAWRLER